MITTTDAVVLPNAHMHTAAQNAPTASIGSKSCAQRTATTDDLPRIEITGEYVGCTNVTHPTPLPALLKRTRDLLRLTITTMTTSKQASKPMIEADAVVPPTSRPADVDAFPAFFAPFTVASCGVGDDVGDVVGDVVGGLLVGEIVGDVVGENVGDVARVVVGDVVGDVVGLVVGDIVGDVVGDLVGEVFGELVGDSVGEVVGDVVGLQ
jgi:hypothetical protein